MSKEGLFHVAASALIINDQHEVLLTQRNFEREHHPGEWETQSGRLHQGESIVEALIREMREELDITVEPLFPIETFHFYRGREQVEHIGVTYLCKIQSGTVKVDGKEEIDFKWFTIDNALKIIKDESIKKDLLLLKDVLSNKSNLFKL